MTVIILGIAKLILGLVFNRLSSDEKTKLFDLKEDERDRKAINAGEEYIRFCETGNKKYKGVYYLIENILTKLSNRDKKIFGKEWKRCKYYLELAEEDFYKNNN